MDRNRMCIALLLVALGSLPGAARAELVINVTGGVQDARPVAVVPFEREAGQFDVAAIVAADLARSGRFAPMDRSDMIDRPARAEEVDYADWRLLGVEALVIGRQVTMSDGRAAVEFRLLDVYRGGQILGRRLFVSGDDWRRAGHQVADMVYEALTGERGAFTTRIAYVTERGRDDARVYSLIIADADGANATPILNSAMPIMSPTWAPDGETLAYVSFQNERAEIYSQHIYTPGQQLISSEPGINGAPAFSPDGRHMAMALSRGSTNLDIFVRDLGNGSLTRMTTNSAADTEPVYSPDGRWIYFTSDRGGGPQIYRLPVEGGRPERVTYDGRYNARPRISPDGRYLSTVHQYQGDYRIAVQDLVSGNLQVLTDGELDESPSFAPNGAIVIYATQVGLRGVLRSVSIDGRYPLTYGDTGLDVREPVWAPYESLPQAPRPQSP